MARKNKISDPRAQSKINKQMREFDEMSAGALSGEQYFDGEGSYDEQYYDAPDDTITLKSKRKATVYVIVALIFMLGAFGAVYMYQMSQRNAVAEAQSTCWLQEQKMEKLVTDYVELNAFNSLPAYVEDVPNYKQTFAACPSGGEYTWNPITGEYTCSMHEHYPEGFAAAQSGLISQNVGGQPSEESTE